MKMKRVAAAVGIAATGLLVVESVATDGAGAAGTAYAQPVAHVGSTVTWEAPTTTTPPAVPVTEKAVPAVKAPHR